jgi:hypothetical protein
MEPINPYASPLVAPGEEPMGEADQPLSLLGALNVGTSLFVRRFPTLAAITLVVWAPLEALISYQEYFVLDPDDPLGILGWSVLPQALVGIVAVGGTISVGEAALRGEHRGWLAGLGDGLRGWPRLFSSQLVGGLLLIVAAFFLLLPALYLGVRFALSDCAAIVERRAGMNAINRSMELTRGRFLTFLGLCVVTIVPILSAGSVIFLPLAYFPQYDHWLLSAALACCLDLLETWMTLVFVAAYVQCRAEERRVNVEPQ